jgi:Dolichyl-phosphate-mannose-protein mannosyltransferase
LQFVRRLRIPALFCALCVLVCELISRPFADMGVCDDGPYILMAHTLATTGHIAYNGWATAMIGWQLYIGAAFVRLFGFSFTAVRMSTLLVSLVLVFILQRTFVHAGITERNAILATLALVLSPLYLMLSATYMSDIFGLFAIVVCLYACLRALQSATPNATILWLCFAVATNAVFGTARQIAWLGVLVMVPSALWLLRAQRRILIAGSAATLAGALFIFACMQWLKYQLYSVPEHIFPEAFPIANTFWILIHLFLEIPFILLPILGLFLFRIRKSSPRVILIISALIFGYLFVSFYPNHLRGEFLLEPTINDWMSARGAFLFIQLHGVPPVFLPEWMQILLTIASLGSFLGLIAALIRPKPAPTTEFSSIPISWKQIGGLLVPFTLAYILILVPRATTSILSDRYLLGLLVVAMLCLTRYYQDSIQPQLPLATVLLIGIMAFYGVTFTHNSFAFYRARVALADELRAAGVPDTSVDNGWEYNLNVELHYATHINDPHILVPAHSYVPRPPGQIGICSMPEFWQEYLPHIRPVYSVSFDPDACYGLAPFAPVRYSRWMASTPGTLYAIRSAAPATP